MADLSVRGARVRLASLWLAQVARLMADYGLRLFVVLELAAAGPPLRDAAWHLATAVAMLPSVFLVPVCGALGNSLPKRAALVGAAAACLVVVAAFALGGAE